MGDGTEFDDALLGLRGFRVLAVSEDGDELLVGIETIRRAAGCPSCGVIARTKDRLRVVVRDLPVFDRRVRLVWSKRRFSCPDPDCPQQTWTERSEELPDRRVLSARAGRECTRAVGQEARVCRLARTLARRLLGDGDVGCARLRDTACGGRGPGRRGHLARHRRDGVSEGERRAPDDVRHRPCRPRATECSST